MNDHISGEDLAAYVDGLLDADKRRALENHFARCPACQDELVEMVAIMRDRDKIPAQFLKSVLGEKNKNITPVLHLRLVFEVAAALVVVVFIGYLFLSSNRFRQAPGRQKTSVALDRAVHPKDAAAAVGAGEMAPQLAQQRDRADAGKGLGDSAAPQKMASSVAVADIPVVNEEPVRTAEQENKLRENAAGSETFSAVQMDFADKEKLAFKGKAESMGETKQNLEKQKKSGVGTALPILLQEENLKDEASQLRASAAVLPTAKAAQPALFPVRIEGDVAWTDLRNPELIFTWSWFPNGLALELQIDGAGTVIAVVPLGKVDLLLARQAEHEAKKLLFSVSEKKSRRARLVANWSPLNPAELQSPHKGG